MKLILSLLMVFNIPIFFYSEQSAEELFYSKVVQIAQDSLNLKRIPSVDGQSFTSDCIGFVLYVYYQAGMDLAQAYGNGNRGVNSLFNGLQSRDFIYTEGSPQPGDLVFFDNTYDANRNGSWDDPLSHIGIVEKIGKHDTIYYIHFSSKGVKRYRLNLKYPNTYAFTTKDGEQLVINSYLRKNRGEGYAKRKYISANFFNSFARIKVKFKDEIADSGQ